MLRNCSTRGGHDVQTYRSENVYRVVQSSSMFGNIEIVPERNLYRTVATLRA
jgi:hypothetical protein